jgi:hypothetical protein
MATKRRGVLKTPLKSPLKRHLRAVRQSTVRGTVLPMFEPNLVLVRKGPNGSDATRAANRSDAAGVMLPKAGEALERPGIAKKAVFRSNGRGRIYAYSAHPKDPTKVVRESSNGTQKTGKLIAGKFKPA